MKEIEIAKMSTESGQPLSLDIDKYYYIIVGNARFSIRCDIENVLSLSCYDGSLVVYPKMGNVIDLCVERH